MVIIQTVCADTSCKLHDSLVNHYPKKHAKPVPDRSFERQANWFPANGNQGLDGVAAFSRCPAHAVPYESSVCLKRRVDRCAVY
jgi:hypothetical protein